MSEVSNVLKHLQNDVLPVVEKSGDKEALRCLRVQIMRLVWVDAGLLA